MNPLIKRYGEEKRWVTYRIEERDGKDTKVPYQVNGRKASSTDEETWSTFADLQGAPAGIIFKPDGLLLGIDIDKCLEGNKIIHDKKDIIAEFIIEADSYSEISPSGTGLHIFLALSEPFQLEANRKSPFEIYRDGRYFTVTQNPYKENREIRTVTPEEATRLLNILGYPWKKKVETKETPSVKRTAISDDRLIDKIAHSKTGEKFAKLFAGDLSDYDKDHSKGDMALCSILAFWTGKDAKQMERIWLASPLGSRPKTQDRQDYRDRTIKAAIENCSEVYESSAQKVERQHPDLDLLFIINDKKDKVLIQNTENMYRIIDRHADFLGRFRYDKFRATFELRPSWTDLWRPLEDSDVIETQTAISILFPVFGKVGKDMIFDAIVKVSKSHVIDSALDYVHGLKWDGQARLDYWLNKVYGVPLDHYHTAVGSNWLKGAVKRIVEPGCKFDYVLVLEGPQGSKKSLSLSTLFGSWHVETTMSTDNKDFFMQFAGKLCVEFSEGETLSRTETKKMKAIITTQFDRYRPPYERISQDFPRRCIFAMTTNQEEYLKDETGNRRWLPVKLAVDEAEVDWLAANRDQLFAEAYHRVVALKEKIYEFPKLETLEAQNKRQIHDPNTDNIINWYHTKATPTMRDQGVTAFEVYRDVYCGGFLSGNKGMDRYVEMAITNVFKRELKLEKNRASVGGIQSTRWFDIHGTVPKQKAMTSEEMMTHAMDHL